MAGMTSFKIGKAMNLDNGYCLNIHVYIIKIYTIYRTITKN